MSAAAVNFKVGDIVSAFGLEGIVSLHNNPDMIYVTFHLPNDCSVDQEFYKDGVECPWHAEPTLKLVKPANTTRTVKLREALFRRDNSYWTMLCNETPEHTDPLFIQWLPGGREISVEVPE